MEYATVNYLTNRKGKGGPLEYSVAESLKQMSHKHEFKKPHVNSVWSYEGSIKTKKGKDSQLNSNEKKSSVIKELSLPAKIRFCEGESDEMKDSFPNANLQEKFNLDSSE
mmetsp:Transcript_21510/g.20668  ORF Transcript_21510/g.20668 Transcript_21510/m.20668 type:complete len:110 (-) Transcript_21510:357-686(-)